MGTGTKEREGRGWKKMQNKVKDPMKFVNDNAAECTVLLKRAVSFHWISPGRSQPTAAASVTR